MQMTRLDVVYEWKLIRKFQKWLYNLHMNSIATRRNVKSDFRIQSRNVIVRAQKTVSTEYQKNVALGRTLTKMTTALLYGKLELYQRFLQTLTINIYVFTTRKDRLKISSAHTVL